MTARIYTPPQCGYEIEGAHCKTAGEIRKKVSGTMMAGILGLSPWSSPFRVACDLLGLAREDISGKASVRAGQALEAGIITYAGKQFADIGLFMAADEMYEKRTGDHDSWVSDFDSDVFAGHVDGIVVSGRGEDYILEVKTSGNLDAWTDGVPVYYYWQVALYNYFITRQDKAYVVLGIVDRQAQEAPASWVPNPNTVVMFEMSIDAAEVEAGIAKVRDWYEQYIVKGITPDYDPDDPGDAEMYNYLVGLTDDIGSVRQMVDELAGVTAQIAEHEAEKQVLYDSREVLKTKIKIYLDCHSMSSLDSASGGYCAALRETHRKRISPEKLKDAGLNPEDFTEETISKTFTINQRK